MKYKKRFQKGFTIVELLIYMVLLSTFLVIMTQLFGSVLDAQTQSESTSNTEQDGRFILLRFMHDVPLATAITTPSALGASSTSLVMTIAGSTYTYSMSGSNLMLTVGGISSQLNSFQTAISNITFTRLGKSGGNDSITISFTVTDTAQQVAGGQITKSYSTTVTTRCNGLASC